MGLPVSGGRLRSRPLVEVCEWWPVAEVRGRGLWLRSEVRGRGPGQRAWPAWPLAEVRGRGFWPRAEVMASGQGQRLCGRGLWPRSEGVWAWL